MYPYVSRTISNVMLYQVVNDISAGDNRSKLIGYLLLSRNNTRPDLML